APIPPGAARLFGAAFDAPALPSSGYVILPSDGLARRTSTRLLPAAKNNWMSSQLRVNPTQGQPMFPLKFRISTKLALSAACGVIVVCGMIANDQIVTSARHKLLGQRDAAETVQKASLKAAVAVRRVIIMSRDIRLARAAADVDDVLKRATQYGGDGIKALDLAISKSPEEQIRTRLAKAKEPLPV